MGRVGVTSVVGVLGAGLLLSACTQTARSPEVESTQEPTAEETTPAAAPAD